uniref:TBK1 binding protein 1 n=1 Tax=Malurus cyaneus samueli TaxID=2593467 RepID=A0A8C5UCJ2_9PASS
MCSLSTCPSSRLRRHQEPPDGAVRWENSIAQAFRLNVCIEVKVRVRGAGGALGREGPADPPGPVAALPPRSASSARTHLLALYEAKEASLLKSEKASLQQQLNQFQHELQKSKEREEQLEEMIQAYEKLCVEKAELETELGEMRALVETHLSRIRSLEQQLRQRDSGAFPGLGAQDVPFMALHPNPGLSHGERRGLEAELEAARQENQRSQHREEQLKAECERLQAELKHLQDRASRSGTWPWLTEELCRLRNLSSLQSQILRALLQEKNPKTCHSPAQQRRSPAPQCPSPAPPGRSQCQSGPPAKRRSAARPPPGPSASRRPAAFRSPAAAPQPSPSQQRRSPAPQCPSLTRLGVPAPPARREDGAGCYPKPSSRHIKAGFQGRRSYSEVTNVALYQQSRSPWLQPEPSTLPKHRPYGELYLGAAGAPSAPTTPSTKPRRFEKQSSDEEEWALPSPPSPEAGAIRCASFCAGFPVPDPDPAHRSAAAYARAEHAQSWPSINLLLETVDSEVRSCPLCQLAFPIGYPDDALVKHIDSHLENSKI